MGSFKSLKRSNVFLTDYLSKKSWTITGSEFESRGIRILTWKSGSLPYYPKEDEKVDGYYPQLAYQEAKQAYFDGMQSDGSVSGSRDLNLQTTITISTSRKLETEYTVISIPKSCFGINIDESSLELNVQGTRLTDREGILRDSQGITVGDVVYNQGLIIIRNLSYTSSLISSLKALDNVSLKFRSVKPIFTYNIDCTVFDREFNKTYNPSATEELQDNPDFTPYVTTIGLYNAANELMAVAKLSKPIKKASNVDMTFNVSLDIA